MPKKTEKKIKALPPVDPKLKSKTLSRHFKIGVGGDVGGDLIVAGGNVQFLRPSAQAALPSLRHIPVSAPEVLVGRDDLCQKVSAALSKGGAVLLFGLGGMGKTALAATIGERALKDKKRYPEGVLWLTVLDRSLEDLCDEVFREAGEIDLVKLPAGEKPAQARRLLGNQKLLVVLDEVTEDNGAAHEWLHGAQPPGTPLLVTSRAKLVGFSGEEIGELERPEAIRLLRQHADRVRDKLDDETADAICAALGDHPLALEIMGALLNERPLDLAKVPGELREAHKRIRDIKTGDKKDENVYASLDLSWRRLDDDRKRVLSRLAAFWAEETGDELLGLACGLSEERFMKATRALYGQSLVRERSGKWAAHALVRAFVRAALGEEAWTATRRAAVKGCAAYAQAHNSESRADHDRLDAERVNLLAAAQWAAEQGMHEEVNRLAGDLYGSSQYLDRAGYTRDALALLETGAAAARALKLIRDESAHLGNLGLAYQRLGQAEKAIDYYEQVLAIHREIGDRLDQGADLTNLGLAYADLGEVEKAIGLYEQALVINREIGERRGEGGALGNLGNAYYRLGQAERAIEYYEQALAIDHDIGNRRGEANALGNLGNAYAALRQAKKATGYHEQALVIAREIGDLRGEGSALGNLGNDYADLRQIEKAIGLYEQALVIAREIGDQGGEGNTLNNLGSAYKNLGQVEKAIGLYEQALAITREIGDRRGEGVNLFNIGLALEKQAQIKEARRRIEQARAIFVEIKAPFVEKCDEALARMGKA